MKKIKINTSVSGPNFTYGPGERSVKDEQAFDLVAAGHAEFVDSDKKDLEKVEEIQKKRKNHREKVGNEMAARHPKGEKAKKE